MAPEVGVRASLVALFYESLNENVTCFLCIPFAVHHRDLLSFKYCNSDLVGLHWLWLDMPEFELISFAISLIDFDPTSNCSLRQEGAEVL